VPDRPHVHVGLAAVKRFLGHGARSLVRFVPGAR
jgi:hypothetical protein